MCIRDRSLNQLPSFLINLRIGNAFDFFLVRAAEKRVHGSVDVPFVSLFLLEEEEQQQRDY